MLKMPNQDSNKGQNKLGKFFKSHLRLEELTSKLEQLFSHQNQVQESTNSIGQEESAESQLSLFNNTSNQIDSIIVNKMGSVEDKQIVVEQANVDSSDNQPDSQENNAKNSAGADESAKENTEPTSLDSTATTKKSESNSDNEAADKESKSDKSSEQQQQSDKLEKHVDESVKQDQQLDSLDGNQLQEQDSQQAQCDLEQQQAQDLQQQQHQQPLINCQVMQSSQKRGTLEQAEKSVQFGEQPEISSTTPSVGTNTQQHSASKQPRGARGYSRRQLGRNYVTGSYQNNYGLLHLPYKSNFEPSEAARRRADEFFKSLNVSTTN